MVGDFNDFQRYNARPFPRLDSYLLEGQNHFKKPLLYAIRALQDIYSTFIWGRHLSFRYAYGGDVVIHGHSPTILFNSSYASYNSRVHPKFTGIFNKFKIESRLPFLFSRDIEAGFTSFDRFPKGGVSTFECAPWAGVEAINVDTASVYQGGALTALGLSSERLKKGELVVITTATTNEDQPQRDPYGSDLEILEETLPTNNKPIFRIIKTGRFGADMSCSDKNPIFPFESLSKQKPKGDY
jgi:hypothetical protein